MTLGRRDAGKHAPPAGPQNPAHRGQNEQSPEDLLRELFRLKVRTKHLVSDQLQGAYSSVFRGQGLSFSEVRGYQPGDDVRWIDWNVSARMSDAFVKVFVEERELTVVLLVDLSQSQAFGTQRGPKALAAAEVAALCAFSATSNRDQVGLILATDVVEKILAPKKGDKQVMRVLREILTHEPRFTGTNLRLALETMVQVTKRRSVVFVISDFFATGYERALALASSKHDVIPVVLTDPRDETLPDVGLASFQDLESGEEILVDTSSARVREHYRATMLAFKTERARIFKKLGLEVATVPIETSVIGPLRKVFERRGQRRRR